MSAVDTVQEHALELAAATGIHVDVVDEENRVLVVLRDVPLPPGLRVTTTDILFITDKQYPLSALDMFWTDVAVVWNDGTVPRSAETIETYLGRTWRRFSWHSKGTSAPTRNHLLDHYALVEARWSAETRG